MGAEGGTPGPTLLRSASADQAMEELGKAFPVPFFGKLLSSHCVGVRFFRPSNGGRPFRFTLTHTPSFTCWSPFPADIAAPDVVWLSCERRISLFFFFFFVLFLCSQNGAMCPPFDSVAVFYHLTGPRFPFFFSLWCVCVCV
eukprot:RCo054570